MRRVEYFSYEVKKARLVYNGLTPNEVAKLLSLPFLNDEVMDGDDYHGPFAPKIYSEVVMNDYGSIENCPYTWGVIFTNKSCKGFYYDDAEEELKWLHKAIEKELGWK